MSELTLHDLSKKLAKRDYAMRSTKSSGGGTTARPMSNDGDHDGDSYFFDYANS